MAEDIQFNNFVTATGYDLSASGNLIYTAVPDFTSVMMLGEVTNPTSNTATISAWINGEGLEGNVSGGVDTIAGSNFYLVKNFKIRPNDSKDFMISGKLVLTSGDRLYLSSNENVHYNISILETQNV